MKEKKWILFRVAVYLCLAIPALLLFTFVYNFKDLFRYQEDSSLERTVFILMSLGLVLQIVFNLLNVRLIHQYAINKTLPPETFSGWHTVLMIFNWIFGALLSLGLIALSVEMFDSHKYAIENHILLRELITLLVYSLYVFLTFDTLISSIRMRTHLKKTVRLNEEAWLNQIGNQPM